MGNGNVMRKWTFLICGFLLFHMSTSLSLDASTAVKVGVYQNDPLVFTDRDGEVKGIYIDVLEHIASKERWKIEYVPGSWPKCLNRLENGSIDLMVGIAYSKERNKLYDFNWHNLLSNWGLVYTQPDSNIETIINLANKKVAVLQNDIYYRKLRQLVKDFKKECRFIEADEYAAVFELIEKKRVDAGVISRLYGVKHEKHYNAVKSPIIFSPIELRFAAPKHKNKAMLEAIDDHLKILKLQQGSIYYQSLDRWLGVSGSSSFPRWLIILLAAGSGLMLVFLSAGAVMRKQVKSRTAQLSARNEDLRQEIAERGRAEKALRESEERYRTVLEANPDPVVVYDIEGKVAYFNPAFSRVFGWDLEERLGKKMDVFVPEENWPETKMMIDKVLAGESFSGIDTRRRTKGGDIIPVSISGAIYRDLDGKPVGSVINLRDISEQEELQAQLQHAQKMEAVGILAGGVAHDFNNLLQAVQGYAELLLLRKERSEFGCKELQAIRRAARRGADLTQQLLTFSRRVDSRLRLVDLNHVIVEVKRLLLRTVPKMIDIEPQLASDLKLINADSAQLEQVLVNLAVNAKDAMPDGGRLVIETATVILDEDYCRTHLGVLPGEYVQLSVSDSGHGMDRGTLEHIFAPFYTTKAVGKGTGLGLAMVYGIVKSHEGYIMCYSEPDEGTTFKIYFPVAEQDGELAVPKEDEMCLTGGTETILLVDDEDFIRDLGKEILTNFGYTIFTAADGESGLEVYRQERDRIDLIILDLIMPGMGGKKCLDELVR